VFFFDLDTRGEDATYDSDSNRLSNPFQ